MEDEAKKNRTIDQKMGRINWPADPDLFTAAQLNATGLGNEDEPAFSNEWWLKQIAVHLAGVHEQLLALRQDMADRDAGALAAAEMRRATLKEGR